MKGIGHGIAGTRYKLPSAILTNSFYKEEPINPMSIMFKAIYCLCPIIASLIPLIYLSITMKKGIQMLLSAFKKPLVVVAAIFFLTSKASAIPFDYTFSGTLPIHDFIDGDGLFAQADLYAGSYFEATFRIDTERKYGEYDEYGDGIFTGYYLAARYMGGSLNHGHVGNGELKDSTLEDGPLVFLSTPYLVLYDISEGFGSLESGSWIDAHYQHGNSMFDGRLQLSSIVQAAEPETLSLLGVGLVILGACRSVRSRSATTRQDLLA